MVSYSGLKCGADHLPSVFAEVDHYRRFLLDPTPAIAPVAHADARIGGRARVGRKLRCQAPRFSGDVEKTTFRWTHLTSSGAPKVDGRGRRYKVRKARPRPPHLLRRGGEQRRRAGGRDRVEVRAALSALRLAECRR